jgi:uncharacterized membrane protein
VSAADRQAIHTRMTELRMSYRVSGPLGRMRLATRATLLISAISLLVGPLASAAAAADGLTITTPFPAVTAQAGSTASFKLTLATPSAERVNLAVEGAPADWAARFHGGGLTVNGAYVDPANPPAVTLDVEIPQDTKATEGRLVVVARDAAGTTARLPLDITIASAASGSVTLTSDYPGLKGPSTSTFTFSLQLKNGTPNEATFALDAVGPDGWTVTAKPQGKDQATSATVPAGGSTTITLTAEAPSDVQAGTFPIEASATGAGQTAKADVTVEITGTYRLTVSTPDQVLSAAANAGTEKDVPLTVNNSGTAPVTGVALSASTPTGWKVTFDPAALDSVDAGQTATVTAKIVPSADAIAGDYEMTVTAKGAEASDDVQLRIRIETPQLWWIAGIALIVLVFAGLAWVFRRYGRR